MPKAPCLFMSAYAVFNILQRRRLRQSELRSPVRLYLIILRSPLRLCPSVVTSHTVESGAGRVVSTMELLVLLALAMLQTTLGRQLNGKGAGNWGQFCDVRVEHPCGKMKFL